ncbi:hypothetical protein [Thiolapillus sp.]|uniref:hypothetical protein n=1 Tax=Thiolapillus sp. TaxID=2017437 RepID=UPI0025E4769C|nr:hypothetical protein [Thiolapillus sp.]
MTADRQLETGPQLLARVIDELKDTYEAEIAVAREEEGTTLADWFWQNRDYLGERFYNLVEEEIGWSNLTDGMPAID